MSENIPAATTTSDSLAGKYLTFELCKEVFGLRILKVREIIGLMDITKVPRTPQYIRGVINLRGKVIPVIDLRRKFGMNAADDTDQTCIIVAELQLHDSACQMGVLVDAVSEVLDIAEDHIESTPAFGGDVQIDFIQGIAKLQDKVTLLLDIDRVVDTVAIDNMNLVAAATDTTHHAVA